MVKSAIKPRLHAYMNGLLVDPNLLHSARTTVLPMVAASVASDERLTVRHSSLMLSARSVGGCAWKR